MFPLPAQHYGFVFIWMLFFVAGLGVGIGKLGTLWHTTLQREKEAELLFIGDQYRLAIENYFRMSPKGQERLPQSLDELLLDPRFPQTVRHLRRFYSDPFSAGAEWGVIRGSDGGIAGVFSHSDNKPFKTRHFPAVYNSFSDQDTYRQWRFIATGVSIVQPNAIATSDGADTASARLPDATKRQGF